MTESVTVDRQSVESDSSNVPLAMVLAGCGGGADHGTGPLTAPTEVMAKLLAGPAVHLTWKDTASEHHYSIERKVTGVGDFAEISTNEFNVTAYHDAAVESGKTYVHRIAGVKADLSKGPYSAEVSTAVP